MDVFMLIHCTSYEILVAKTKFLVALATRKAQFRALQFSTVFTSRASKSLRSSISWHSLVTFRPSSRPSRPLRPGIQGVPGMPDTPLERVVDFFTKGSVIQINVVSLKGARKEKGVVLSCLKVMLHETIRNNDF